LGELGYDPAEKMIERHRPFEPDPGNTGGGKEVIIAAHSYKGGTGKTLFSVNLAILLANRGNKVCLLDLDLRAPSLNTIFESGKREYWLNDYLNQTCEIEEVLMECSLNCVTRGQLFVGLANPSVDAIREMMFKDRTWEMKALCRLLSLKESLLKEVFDYVIFDTSPGFRYNSINAIVSADVVFVITTLEKSDMDGTQRMVTELYDLFEKKTEIMANKIPSGHLPSKGCKRKEEDLKGLGLPVIGAIPCSCEILKSIGEFFFATEKPNNPFTQTLEKIAIKIENHQLNLQVMSTPHRHRKAKSIRV
jgi:MinD-like ATPase involved in chromosome partitioning or flagellar assembly